MSHAAIRAKKTPKACMGSFPCARCTVFVMNTSDWNPERSISLTTAKNSVYFASLKKSER